VGISQTTCHICGTKEIGVYTRDGYKKYGAHEPPGKTGRCEMSDHDLPNQKPPKYVSLDTTRKGRPIQPMVSPSPRDEFEALFGTS